MPDTKTTLKIKNYQAIPKAILEDMTPDALINREQEILAFLKDIQRSCADEKSELLQRARINQHEGRKLKDKMLTGEKVDDEKLMDNFMSLKKDLEEMEGIEQANEKEAQETQVIIRAISDEVDFINELLERKSAADAEKIKPRYYKHYKLAHYTSCSLVAAAIAYQISVAIKRGSIILAVMLLVIGFVSLSMFYIIYKTNEANKNKNI